MKIYSHEELVQAKEQAQADSIRLRKENDELKRVVRQLQEKSAEDFKLINELVDQRNMFAESLKNHHDHLY